MNSPTTALLWHSFRLTRGRLVFMIAFAIAAGWVALSLPASTPGGVEMLVLAVVSLLALLWLVATPLMGDRCGFPFRLDFARPAPTWLLVAVPLAYVGLATAAVYVVPMLVLGAAFGTSLPLSPVAPWIAATVVAFATCCWWTRYGMARGLSSAACAVALIAALPDDFEFPAQRASWAEAYAFEWADYAPMLLVVAAAFAVAVFGVERQRRGDDWAGVLAGTPLAKLRELYRDGWGELLRARCPISSPGRAELWLEMKYRGAPVLAFGVIVAAAVPALFWLNHAQHPLLPLVVALGMLTIPLLVGANASIWSRGGNRPAALSAFEAARAVGTARLAGLQVSVTAGCTLVAMTLIGASIWLSLPLFDAVSRAALRRDVAAELGAIPAGRLVRDGAFAVIGLATAAALLHAFNCVAQRYGTRTYAVLVGLGAYFLLLAFAVERDWVGWPVVAAHLWLAAAVVPLVTALAFADVLRARVLAVRPAGAFLVAWAGFAAIYLAFLRDSGILLAELPAVLATLAISSSLLPLAAVALAPWSLRLVRHV